MKRVIKPVLLTMIILGALTGGAVFLLTRGEGSSSEFAARIASEQSDQTGNRIYRYDSDKNAVELKLSGEGKNVLNFDSQNAYQVSTSTAARDRLDRLIKRTAAGFDNPIIAANPFGTNENTFYFFFETGYRGMVRYTIAVEDESITDHVRYVQNGQEKNLTQTHEFIVGGLIPGRINYILIEVLDSTGAMRENCLYKYKASGASVPDKLGVQAGRSKENCKNGLFFVFPKGDKKIYAYDNGGVLRGMIQTESAHGRRIYQSGDSIIYQVSDTKIAKVSALGRVTAAVEVRGYGKIRDFSYDGYDFIYSLVKKKKKEYLLATSFQTGKTRVVYSFPKGIETGSLTTPMAGGVYVACRKPSGIIKLDALTGQSPKAAFVLGRKAAWKKTSLKKKVAKDKNAIRWNTANAFLNSVDDKADTFCTYLLDSGRGTGMQLTVDGKKKSVKVDQSFPVGKGGASGCQDYDEHFLIYNCKGGTYEEYDAEGNVTKQFSLGRPIDSMFKLTLNGMCFYNGEG